MAENTNTERARFDAWYSSNDEAPAEPERVYELTEEGMNELTKDCVWQGWQARASLSLPAAGQEPAPIHALMCVISSLRDTAHFSDEEGEVTNDLRRLRDWIFERAAAPQPAVAAGWVPTDSAPKDGTEFLAVYGRQGNVKQLVKWNKLHGHWESKGEWVPGFESNVTAIYLLPPAPSTEGESNDRMAAT